MGPTQKLNVNETQEGKDTMFVELPKMMKAALGKDYGDIDEMLSVQDNVPLPDLTDNTDLDNAKKMNGMIKSATKQDRKSHMIIQTLAVALAPGDCRVLSGKTREFQGPPKFPYIPGGDCCGVVVQTNEKDSYFQPGDVVAARFTCSPRDAMAEYARVSTNVCEKINTPLDNDKKNDTAKKDDDVVTMISPEEAACLASASPATILCDNPKYIKPNDRVLVLGAGGGVGSHLVQLARSVSGAGFICGSSRNPQRLLNKPLNCDDAIDYTQMDIFSLSKYQNEPFDVIIDLACGGWLKVLESRKLNQPSIIKPASLGGRYITITSDVPTFEAHSLMKILAIFMLKPLWRAFWTRLPWYRKSVPAFTQANGLPDTRDVLTRTFELARSNKVKAVVDGPYPFTTKGVCQAFRKLESRHGEGKVVVKVADLSTIKKTTVTTPDSNTTSQ